MASRVVLLVALLFVLQGFRCETVLDVTEEYTAKFAAIVATTDAQARKIIVQTDKTVKEKTAEVTVEIAQMKGTLAKAIGDAEAEAAVAGKDITKCIDQAKTAFAEIKPHEAQGCIHDVDMMHLTLRLRLIIDLQSKAVHNIKECVGNNPTDTSSLRVCLETDIAKFQDFATTGLAGISRDTETIKGDSFSCLDSILGRNSNVTSTALLELNQCATSALLI